LSDYQARGGLSVATPLIRFAEGEALPDSGIDKDEFWRELTEIIRDLGPKNAALLAERDRLQQEIDEYHRAHPGVPEPHHYRRFLAEIGYLVPPELSQIETRNVDTEISAQAGPQLVVPLLNARFAVNAANARWGSLYDALYGTDAIPLEGELAPSADYNPRRGAAVIARGREVLDQSVPLAVGAHAQVVAYRVVGGALQVELADGSHTGLANVDHFAGFTGDPAAPTGILFTHHGLHLDVRIDRDGSVGSTDVAGVQDIVVESALTTIMDLEDSVAAVDAEDKALGYHNWRELMRGTLSATVTKDESTFTRRMNSDRAYTAPDGSVLSLPGRSLLFVRHVGHLMTSDAVLVDGRPVPEGILDAVMTGLGALPDLCGMNVGGNSRAGSFYVVKPKMHGPAEVAFTAELFGRVEHLLGLPPATIKMGIMDEERRTTVNLEACISAARDRVVFVNTGFLDRTGDDIHTSMHAGPMVPKDEMRSQPFMRAYERRNVDVALRAGFARRAQIGKGMWAMPDLMNEMLQQKIGHVRSGATTAWVPSPTAATLHALHYHQVDAFAVQEDKTRQPPVLVDDVLVPPIATSPIPESVRRFELDNAAQSILGYVVRWIDQGVGCSKVPNIHGIALMEDRATLRISSQLLANWLLHGVVTETEVDDALQRQSRVVDAQNAADPHYENLIDSNGPGLAYRAARELIVQGAGQPNGYTELVLHRFRRKKKQERLR
jgi:malate synthase